MSSFCYHVTNRSYPTKAIGCDSSQRVCLRKTHISARFFALAINSQFLKYIASERFDRFTFSGLCYMYGREDQFVRLRESQAGQMLKER